MEELSIKNERNKNVTVITVSGRVDSVTAATLDAELAKIVSDNYRIVLDLKDVSYLSSAGVRAIVRTLQSAQKLGGGVKLAQIPENVSEVLQTVGMMQMMQVYSSVDEAVGSF
jgi:anti-sigma B factor antagonist